MREHPRPPRCSQSNPHLLYDPTMSTRPTCPVRSHRVWKTGLALLISSFASFASAQGNPGAPPRPAGSQAAPPTLPASAGQQAPVRVEPTILDFGLVEPSQSIPGVFRITNTSSSPLVIVTTLTSCKCTTTQEYSGQRIAPGATFELSATMDAPSTPGVKEANINVVFQDFTRPTVLKLKCDVRLPIRAVEEFVDALKGVNSGVLTIESRDGKPFRIVSSNGAPPSFVDFDPTKDAPRSSYKVNWSVEGWPCEGMRLWWVIETDREDCPILPCRIRHECTGLKADPNFRERKWMVKDPLVSAGRIKAGRPIALRAEVENAEPKAGPNRPAKFSNSYREISAVQSMSPQLSARLVAVEPRGTDEALVRFEIIPKEGVEGFIYAVVRLVSPTGTADVPVVAVVAPGAPSSTP